MRIASGYAQQAAVDGIADRQARMVEAQQRVASGRRVERPSDDPAAAAEAERLRSRGTRLEAEQRALEQARQRLTSADNALGDATDVLQSARETLLAAGNATLVPADRAKHAVELGALRERLLAIANRQDGTGGFVFGGQGTRGAPVPSTGTSYLPQPGTQLVGQEQASPVSLDGRENFVAIRTPTGTESIFAQLDAAIAAFADPATTPAAAATASGTAIDALDRSLDRFATTRTVVGERLRGLDAHEQSLANGRIDVETRRSDLVDLDFARGVSDLVQQQTAFDAALKSYAQIARMTLFDYV